MCAAGANRDILLYLIIQRVSTIISWICRIGALPRIFPGVAVAVDVALFQLLQAQLSTTYAIMLLTELSTW